LRCGVHGAEALAFGLPFHDQRLQSPLHGSCNAFQMVDIMNMPYIEYLAMAGEIGLISDSPRVNAWWNRLAERPTWQQVTGKTGSAA